MNELDYNELLENLILFSLDINSSPTIKSILTSNQKKVFDKTFRFEDREAKSFICSGASLDRRFTHSRNELMNNPIDIIGDGIEVGYYAGVALNWTKIIKIDTPKHIKFKRPPVAVYEFHSKTLRYKEIFDQYGIYFDEIESKKEDLYTKEYLALDSNGLSIPYGLKISKTIAVPNSDVAFACSIVEDAYSTMCFRVAIKTADIEVVFPAAVDCYKEMLALREMKSANKKRIAHWVSRHLRKTKTKTDNRYVKSHIRGCESFTIGGVNVSLIPNDDEKWWDKKTS